MQTSASPAPSGGRADGMPWTSFQLFPSSTSTSPIVSVITTPGHRRRREPLGLHGYRSTALSKSTGGHSLSPIHSPSVPSGPTISNSPVPRAESLETRPKNTAVIHWKAIITMALEIDNFTIVLLVVLVVLALYHRFYAPAPLVHPLLLGRQAEVSSVRQPGESGIYRSWATGQGTPVSLTACAATDMQSSRCVRPASSRLSATQSRCPPRRLSLASPAFRSLSGGFSTRR